MEASKMAGELSGVLEFEGRPTLYSSERSPYHAAGRSFPHDRDDHDFALFIEERLHRGSSSLYADAMTWMERRLLLRVLEQTNGNKSKACQVLGITRGSLRHKISQLGISIHQTVSVLKPDAR